MKIQNLIVKLLFFFSIFSCQFEKFEEFEEEKPLAECIDGHAKVVINEVEYEYECENYDLVGYISLEEMEAESGNDCWGWTDPLTNKEYALMGLDNGTAIIDISRPTKPKYLGKIPTETVPSSWRDLKIFDNHVFIVSEAENHGMQVYDLEQLRVINDVQNLTNTNKLPFIITVGCNPGEFNTVDECFCESWMRSTDEDSNPIGAVGHLGSTIS